jgi:hypothetical protein
MTYTASIKGTLHIENTDIDIPKSDDISSSSSANKDKNKS